MSWNAAPVLAVGAILTAGDWNSVAGDINILATYVPTFGTSGAMAGTAPTAGTPVLLLQTGYNASQTATSAAFTQSLPTAYPNGVVVWLGNAAETANQDDVQPLAAGTSTTTLAGNVYRNGSPLTGSFRLAWIALGY